MRVLVTGGAGYLGSVLAPLLLEQGHQVRVLDDLLHGGTSLLGLYPDLDFDFLKGDVRCARDVEEAMRNIDVVVHLAAIVGDPACARQPDLAREVNIEGSMRLLEEARRRRLRSFVFASTCSNYGRMADGSGYLDEQSELRPVSLYAETKVTVEKALLASSPGEPAATVLRCATLHGVSPRMRFDLTVNEFAKDLLTRRKLVVFGKQFWRPYLHVRDAARAVTMVLDAPPEKVRGEIFNVGDSSQNYRKEQIADLVCAQLDSEAEIEHVHKAEDPRDYRVSFEKIRRELDFSITRDVTQGIREVMDVIRKGIITEPDDARYRN